MNFIIKPFKNESYPYIVVLLLTSFINIIFITLIPSGLIYVLLTFLFLIINTIIIIYIIGIASSNIKLSDNSLECTYIYKRIRINYEDIISVSDPYSNKKIYAKRGELYKIKVYKVSDGKNDIFFHHIEEKPIKSAKNLNEPYKEDPSLQKGLWISTNDAAKLIDIIKHKIPYKKK